MKLDSVITHGCDSCNPDWLREMRDMESDYQEKPQSQLDGSAAQTTWPYWNTDKPDVVHNPPHYRQGKIECIDAIEAALTPEEYRGYLKGTVMKYLWRERYKGGDESVHKAEWFLKRIYK